jgi:hypothetical protein
MEFKEINVQEGIIQQIDHDWSSWKMVDEINMERARYLLSTDEI